MQTSLKLEEEIMIHLQWKMILVLREFMKKEKDREVPKKQTRWLSYCNGLMKIQQEIKGWSKVKNKNKIISKCQQNQSLQKGREKKVSQCRMFLCGIKNPAHLEKENS